MKHIKDLYCGYDDVLTNQQKEDLNDLTLKIFKNTAFHKRPKPSLLVSLITNKKLKLKKPKN